LVCFRFHPKDTDDLNVLNNLNEKLLLQVNGTGQLYISHTKLKGIYSLRIVTGQTTVESGHIEKAWKIIQNQASIIHPLK
jgi:aromatic-L-amino-acid decarboxylase